MEVIVGLILKDMEPEEWLSVVTIREAVGPYVSARGSSRNLPPTRFSEGTPAGTSWGAGILWWGHTDGPLQVSLQIHLELVGEHIWMN